MARITLNKNETSDGWSFGVVVEDEKSKTIHEVSLSKEYYQRMTGGLQAPEDLVRVSFEFLLEREPKEGILAKFDLSQIKQHFPEYEFILPSKLSGGI